MSGICFDLNPDAGYVQAQMKLGILFLHHTQNAVTLNNLQSVRRQNPKATVVTMSPDNPLPGGYCLTDTPHLKEFHSQMPKRREDFLVCSWFLQKKEKCDKWWIIEWDVFCEVPVVDYYKDVWHYSFVASSVCLPNREPSWYWFRHAAGTPESYRPYIMGALPFLFLFSEAALDATCQMLLDDPFTVGNSELRFATAANRCGYPPCGFSPPRDRITWRAFKKISGSPTIFHPVKHLVDYR